LEDRLGNTAATAWLQASAATIVSCTLFWGITQRRVLFTDLPIQHTVTIVKSSSVHNLDDGTNICPETSVTLEDWTDMLSRNVGKQLPHDTA
jgi:hypothetical protein